MNKQKERLSRQQWAAHGLKALGQKGVGALRIDELCERLKVTKGSFYWHFKGREEFLAAVLDYWQQIATFDIIERFEKHGGSPEDQVAQLFEEANSGIVDFSAEQAIRHWARSNKQATAAVLLVDEQRIKFLVSQFKAMNYSKGGAKTQANLMYALIISEPMIYQREKPAMRKQRQSQSFKAIMDRP